MNSPARQVHKVTDRKGLTEKAFQGLIEKPGYKEVPAAKLRQHVGKMTRVKQTLPDGSVKFLAGGILVFAGETETKFRSVVNRRPYTVKPDECSFWVLATR